MNIIKTIKEWLINQRNERKLARKMEFKHEACQDIQLIEYNGEIHISFFGTPIVPERLLKKNALETLNDLREVYVNVRSGK